MRLENGGTCDAFDVQYAFLELAQKHLAGADEETDWLIERWGFTLDAIRNKPEALIGGVDWISKKWLLDAFREEENLTWQDPWLQSLDLEYHNINPAKGLFFALTPAKAIGEYNDRVRSVHAPAASAREYPRAGTVGRRGAFPAGQPVLRHQLGFDLLREPEPFSDERPVSGLRKTDPEVFATHLTDSRRRG